MEFLKRIQVDADRPPLAGLPAAALMLMVFLLLPAGAAAPLELQRQTITLPANAGRPLFVDVDGDGRADLLVIDQATRTISYFRQGPVGFTNAPVQVIPLPPQTAWAGPSDVDPHPGLELLFSTVTGLVYSRQSAGVFESERRVFVEAKQAFTGAEIPILTSRYCNPVKPDATNRPIPVIAAGQALLYERDGAYDWKPGPPLTLAVERTSWTMSSDPEARRRRGVDFNSSEWAMGPNPSCSLHVQKALRSGADRAKNQEPETEAVRKIIAWMKEEGTGLPRTQRIDVNGDGRDDLVMWQVNGKLDLKTDIFLFLRGADQRLPERPTQILHVRGFPIPIRSTSETSLVNDLDGDGICELVLLEPGPAFASPSGVLEMLLSHGLDWLLTVRTFRQGLFSTSPDSMAVTAVLPSDDSMEWPVCVAGDFNGDGSLDFLVRRSETQWNVFYSIRRSGSKGWFAPEPALTFSAPFQGYLEVKDLNGDGLADVVWHEPDEAGLAIFVTPARGGKGNP